MSATERLSRALLRLYPRRFRDEFGDDVIAFVHARASEARYATRAGRVRLVVHVLADGLAGAARERCATVLNRHRLPVPAAIDAALPSTTVPPEELMVTLAQDLRYAVRTLRRRPAFTVVAAVTLSLGIGATAAIFGFVDVLMFRPLRYPASHELVTVTMTRGSSLREPAAYPDFLDWREQASSFQSVAVARWQSINLTGGDAPERLAGNFGSASLLTMLGAEPIAGRVFLPEETETGTARPVVVMSEGLWRRRFGADPGLVGQTIMLNGQAFTVIGIVPSTFTFFAGTDVWLPIAYYPNASGLTRKDHSMTVLARLRPEVTLAAARAEMRAVGARLAQLYPDENGGSGVHVESLHTLLVGDVKGPLYIVLGAVAVVLLIACANVANLQLAHAVARRREISVRAALGAGRGRLARQLLTESLILSVLGGALGIAVAHAGVAVLTRIVPIDLTFFNPIAVDARVLAFAAAVAIGTGIIFGLAPALHASRTDLNDALATRASGLVARVGRVDLRGAFVVAQIALSVVLLVGAGLLARSLTKLREVDLGFDPSNVVTMEFRLPATKYDEPRKIADFFTRAIEEIRAVPGVGSAALVRAIPFSGNGDSRAYAVDGAPEPATGKAPILQLNTVSSDYFETVRLPLVAGRDIDPRDDPSAPPVVVVNETFARREWPNASAIGRRVRFIDSERWFTVVGVVRDAKHFGPTDAPRPQMYVHYKQNPQIFTSVAVRAAGDAAQLGNAVRDAIWRVDRDQPVWKIRTLASIVDGALGSERVLLGLVATFAAVSLLLAAVGIYGVMSFAVTQRTHEVGVRIALGARRGQVIRLVVGQGLRLTAVALVVGLIAAVGASRVLASELFGVTPADPFTFAVVPLVLGAVAVMACYLPARRASRLDPLAALRRD